MLQKLMKLEMSPNPQGKARSQGKDNFQHGRHALPVVSYGMGGEGERAFFQFPAQMIAEASKILAADFHAAK